MERRVKDKKELGWKGRENSVGRREEGKREEEEPVKGRNEREE